MIAGKNRRLRSDAGVASCRRLLRDERASAGTFPVVRAGVATVAPVHARLGRLDVRRLTVGDVHLWGGALDR